MASTFSAEPSLAVPVASDARRVLVVRGLRKAVPGKISGGDAAGRLLFSGLDLEVAAGEFVAIMGESGVGKSTLLNLMAGLDSADDGSVEVAGQSLAGLSDDARSTLRRDHIGFVFQAFHILPHLTLGQNVALPMMLAGAAPAAALARAEALIADVGLDGRAADFSASLSGGELQRIAIARALVHRPALLLADEPTGNLDPETAGLILDLLVREARQRGAALVMVTHSDRAAAAADRVLRLSAQGLSPAS